MGHYEGEWQEGSDILGTGQLTRRPGICTLEVGKRQGGEEEEDMHSGTASSRHFRFGSPQLGMGGAKLIKPDS